MIEDISEPLELERVQCAQLENELGRLHEWFPMQQNDELVFTKREEYHQQHCKRLQAEFDAFKEEACASIREHYEAKQKALRAELIRLTAQKFEDDMQHAREPERAADLHMELQQCEKRTQRDAETISQLRRTLHDRTQSQAERDRLNALQVAQLRQEVQCQREMLKSLEEGAARDLQLVTRDLHSEGEECRRLRTTVSHLAAEQVHMMPLTDQLEYWKAEWDWIKQLPHLDVRALRSHLQGPLSRVGIKRCVRVH